MDINDNKVISFCPNCISIWTYDKSLKDEDKKQICGAKNCGAQAIHTKITRNELDYIRCISKDREFLAAMNELRNNDIIAYKERMAQYKKIYEETHKPLLDNKIQFTQQQTCTQVNIPKCPTCGSTNIEKISVGKKIKGSMLFGLFSNDAKKQMRCNDCGYKF